MPKRVQSPSSINTYRQCPRKYYYQYISKLPGKGSIHLIRGNIAHTTLEKFFDIDVEKLHEEDYEKELTFYLKNLFQACWRKEQKELLKLHLTEQELTFYYEETIMMLANWLQQFIQDLRIKKEKTQNTKEAFNLLKPTSIEEYYKSEELSVQGYIDYIQHIDDEVHVMDYKTSKKFNMTPDYYLQLGIYALMYKERHGKYPNKVGIWFLKDEAKIIPVDEDLVTNAQFEIEQIHAATENSNTKEEYPKKISGLCKWKTGQCDFHEVCFQNMTEARFKELHFMGKK